MFMLVLLLNIFADKYQSDIIDQILRMISIPKFDEFFSIFKEFNKKTISFREFFDLRKQKHQDDLLR